MTSPEIRISVYENEVPAFVENELIRLYGTLESSLAYLRVYRDAAHASTYVARNGEQVIAVFLFRRQGRHVQVLNEGMVLDAAEIERFAGQLFNGSEAVAMLTFPAVRLRDRLRTFPHQRSFWTEDTILRLPATVDAYLAGLGAATRKNIKRHHNRLLRVAPSFCFHVYEKEQVSEQQIQDIISLNHARMAGKSKVSAINHHESKRISQMAKECGVVALTTIEGRVCAGTIMFHIGNNYISRVNAHDPQYDCHRLGTLCCFLAICECIRRGGHRFHFMPGKEEYKSALLGSYQRFDAVVVYRSARHYFLDGRNVLMRVCKAQLLAANRWLLDRATRQDSAADRVVGLGIKGLRKIVRFMKASLAGP
jgi:hypothetical protein